MTMLRLLKVVVQPVFVIDDGENLIEQLAQPIEVSPAEWPTFATKRFVESVKALEEQIADAQIEKAKDSSNSKT